MSRIAHSSSLPTLFFDSDYNTKTTETSNVLTLLVRCLFDLTRVHFLPFPTQEIAIIQLIRDRLSGFLL